MFWIFFNDWWDWLKYKWKDKTSTIGGGGDDGGIWKHWEGWIQHCAKFISSVEGARSCMYKMERELSVARYLPARAWVIFVLFVICPKARNSKLVEFFSGQKSPFASKNSITDKKWCSLSYCCFFTFECKLFAHSSQSERMTKFAVGALVWKEEIIIVIIIIIIALMDYSWARDKCKQQRKRELFFTVGFLPVHLAYFTPLKPLWSNRLAHGAFSLR